jgi:hypothetical protein
MSGMEAARSLRVHASAWRRLEKSYRDQLGRDLQPEDRHNLLCFIARLGANVQVTRLADEPLLKEELSDVSEQEKVFELIRAALAFDVHGYLSRYLVLLDQPTAKRLFARATRAIQDGDHVASEF